MQLLQRCPAPRVSRQAQRGVAARVSSSAPSATSSQHAVPGHPDIKKVLYSEEELKACCSRLGQEIGRDYAGKHLILVGVLKGSYMFCADVARAIHPPPPICELEFLKASSYGVGATETTGTVKIDGGFSMASVTGKHVLLCEDIIDSGLTLTKVTELIRTQGKPTSIKVVTLLDKRERRKVHFDADYVGFNIANEFVVGYGIDYSERFRFLPFIGVPTDEAVARIAAECAAFNASNGEAQAPVKGVH
ncbi:hypothetical protein FOA52_005661 [Chlamydomonas sp. UWO 241]|nr:hypothetical protein FOA52_005661 [Chlamydomonas sp. UWO 241]